MFLAVLSIAILDFFGLEVGARNALHDGFNQVMVDWYASFPSRRDRSEPPPAEVAVVLWQESDITPNRGWPLPYKEHAEALGLITAAKPRAVFIDVLFKDRRPEGDKSHDVAIQELRDVVRNTAASGIPLYFLNEGDCTRGGVLPSLLPAEKSTPSYIVPVTVSAPRATEDTDGVARTYTTFADDAVRGAEAKLVKECATAPLRMHLDQRKRERPTATSPDPEKDLADTLRRYARPLSLFWGGCGGRKALAPMRFVQWILGRDIRLAGPCLPFDVLTRDALANPDGQRRLQDKLVVYGTDFTAAGDRATTAAHQGRIAGAMVNAMALDNLQRWDTGYVHRAWPVLGTNELTGMDVILLALGALLFPVVRRLGYVERLRAWVRRIGFAGQVPELGPRRLATAAAATLPVAVLVPIVLFAVVAAPLVFLLTTNPVGTVAAHMFAWGFVEETIAVWQTFLANLAPETSNGGSS